jgi:acetate kinase
LKVLVFNAGSSSLKFSLFEAGEERLLAEGGIDWGTNPTRLLVRSQGHPETGSDLALRGHADAVARLLEELRGAPLGLLQRPEEVRAVGHRIVHGGMRFTEAVRITPEVRLAIGQLAPLAPLHNPASLEVIDAAGRLLPQATQVAAFDTAFHATLSEAARTYPVPRHWTREWGLRRYGFHGLSHAYCARRATEMLRRRIPRLIIAHLGNGASVAAVRDGVCVDTTMGFTPLEGLMMGTRSGTVDPGLLIHVLRDKGLDVDRLDHALQHESGLLGVSRVSSDMRQVLAAAPHDPDARLAVEVYVHRIRQSIGAMAATLGGVDALVFTAGVGENAVEIRERVCDNLDYLGLQLDRRANGAGKPDSDIALADSPGRILVVATREDLTIVRDMRRLAHAGEGTEVHVGDDRSEDQRKEFP